MNVIKIIDFLVDKFYGEHRGDIIVHELLNERESIINIMKKRLMKLESENLIEEDFKRLSKEQEMKFIKNLILRLESKND